MLCIYVKQVRRKKSSLLMFKVVLVFKVDVHC